MITKNPMQLQGFWKKYEAEYDYAKGIEFQSICDAILNMIDTMGL